MSHREAASAKATMTKQSETDAAPCNDVREYFRKTQHWRSHLWLEIRRKVGRDEAVDGKTDDDHEGREKAARVLQKVKRRHRRGVFLDCTEKKTRFETNWGRSDWENMQLEKQVERPGYDNIIGNVYWRISWELTLQR